MKDSAGLSSPEVRDLGPSAVAVQPVGAYEQHGPHLPLATDATIATEIAVRALALLDHPIWLLPTIPYGKSVEHSGHPGTITLSGATFTAICMDVARSVAASGIRTLVFVNAHGGNPDLLHLACRDIHAELGIRAFSVHAPDLPLDVPVPGTTPDVHAGFYETSVMLAIDPERVAVDRAEPGGESGSAAMPLEQLVRLPWHVDDLSRNGVIGDPTGANSEWGQANLTAQARSLAALLRDLAGLWDTAG